MDTAGTDDDAEGERDYYRAVPASINGAVSVVDPDHTVAFVNERFLEGERDEARVEIPAPTDPLGDHVVEVRLTPYEPAGEREGVVVELAARPRTPGAAALLDAAVNAGWIAGRAPVRGPRPVARHLKP